MKILIVDDEKEITDLIEVYLKNEGYTIDKCYDGSEAMKLISTQQYDLALLDVMLPGVDGFTLCRKIRERGNYPVIMLTAKVEETDKITGFSLGADDYITKPFSPLEMVARVKAQLRRYTRYNSSQIERNVIDFNGLIINKDTHQCSLYGKELKLTPTEFSLLWILSERRGKVISSEELFEQVWGEKFLESNNTVMVHIRRLREKMGENSSHPKFIKTVWGVGYKIEKDN